jgi:hypothetical protein
MSMYENPLDKLVDRAKSPYRLGFCSSYGFMPVVYERKRRYHSQALSPSGVKAEYVRLVDEWMALQEEYKRMEEVETAMQEFSQ